jgi:hypothetical protein
MRPAGEGSEAETFEYLENLLSRKKSISSRGGVIVVVGSVSRQEERAKEEKRSQLLDLSMKDQQSLDPEINA